MITEEKMNLIGRSISTIIAQSMPEDVKEMLETTEETAKGYAFIFDDNRVDLNMGNMSQFPIQLLDAITMKGFEGAVIVEVSKDNVKFAFFDYQDGGDVEAQLLLLPLEVDPEAQIVALDPTLN